MTQHEYVFVAVSIILGLAMTRLLHTVAMLIRAHVRVQFHWSSALWGICIMAYILQLWWVGWGLRELKVWDFSDFLVLVAGSICVYGAAEMALPVPEEEQLDMLAHNRGLGRLSALSMGLYFFMGPYFNLVMYDNPVLPALILPAIGLCFVAGIIARARFFPVLSPLFAAYTVVILYVTA